MSGSEIDRALLVAIRRGALIFGCGLAIIGGTLSLFALKSGAESWTSPLISFFSWLPVARLSRGSAFPSAGAISAIFCAPIVFISAVGNIADILIDYRPNWARRSGLAIRLKVVSASLSLLTIGIVLLCYWNGGDVRVIKFGSSVLCMVFLGWVPFWLFGFLIAHGAVGLWKSITY